MKLFFVLIFIFLLCSINNLYANNEEALLTKSPLYKSLSSAAQNGGITAVTKIIKDNGLNTFDNINIVSFWLRDEYKKPQRNQRYGLMYADILKVMADIYNKQNPGQGDSLMGTGLFAFFSSYLIARENVSRCEDETAYGAHLQSWETDLKTKYLEYLDNLSVSEREKSLTTIISFSGSRDLSIEDKLACANGMKALSQAIENGNCSKEGSCKSDEYVTFISDEEWQVLKTKIRKDFEEFFINYKPKGK